jgi:hypothetical protein
MQPRSHAKERGAGSRGCLLIGGLIRKICLCDATPYHDPPGSKRLSYLEHWARELSLETAIGDAARVAATTAANRRKRRADGCEAVEP